MHPLSLPLDDTHNSILCQRGRCINTSLMLNGFISCFPKSGPSDHCNFTAFTNFAGLFLQLQKRDGSPELPIS